MTWLAPRRQGSRWVATMIVRPASGPPMASPIAAAAARGEVRRRLVEQQQRRVAQERPGQGELLALTGRQPGGLLLQRVS